MKLHGVDMSPCLQQNLEGVLGFQLAREDYERICAIPFQLRLVDGIRFLRPEGPYRWGTSDNVQQCTSLVQLEVQQCVVLEDCHAHTLPNT